MSHVLCRAKVKDENDPKNGEWVKGFYVELDVLKGYSYHIIYTGYSETDCGYCPGFHEVDPETVGRYIGKTDINEKEIFEGDILISTAEIGHFVVVFKPEISCFVGERIENPSHGRFVFLYENREKNLTVIGNIYDNHKLVEAKKNDA